MKENHAPILKGSLIDCLYQLTIFYNCRTTYESLVSQVPLQNNDIPLEFFERVANSVNFLSMSDNILLKNMHPGLFPCILQTTRHQYVILFSLSNTEAVVFADGVKKNIPLQQLEAEYGGFAILVKVNSGQEENRENDVSLFALRQINWFWKVMKEAMVSYSGVLLASFLINIFALASPLFVMNVYDRVVPNAAIATLWTLVVGVSIVYIFDLLLRLLRVRYVDNAASMVDMALSVKIFEHIIKIRYADKPNRTGKLFNDLQGFESFREFITSLTLTTLIDFPFIIIFLVTIALIGGKLVIVPLLLVPFILVMSFIIQAPLIQWVRKSCRVSGEKQQTLLESFVGIVAIKSQNAEVIVQRRWEQLISYATRINKKVRFLTSLAVNVTTFSQQFSYVIVIILGVYMIISGEITMGALIACTVLVSRCLAPIAQVVSLVLRYYQSINSIKELDHMMQLPCERPVGKKFISPERIEAEIEFKNVVFSYPHCKQQAITEVNLHIKQGEHTAIIGRMGSGKTTLLQLMVGLYQPSAGKVFLSRNDLQMLDPTLVRKHIGYVAQSPILFSGSIRDNISLGNPNVADDDILSAIRLVGLDKFINEHPDGLYLQVGERGELLSGGQKQAVTLCRAVLNKPQLLILDEPTSSMDESNENSLIKRLNEYLKNRTLIIATHKTNLLRLVKRVVVLEKGRVYMDGAKEEVILALQENKSEFKSSPKNNSDSM